MLDSNALIKFEDGWKFATEENLEDFVWNNLEKLLNLQPISRQFRVSGEICDLLGLNEKGHLVIVELKNTEDRYVVQQLTRYYDNLIVEKPNTVGVNWNNPIHLVAITPNFHRHNIIDQKHSKLKLDFLSFEISQNAKELHFKLKDSNGKYFSQLKIPYPENLIIEDLLIERPAIIIPRIPKTLKKVLDENLPEYSNEIVLTRERILSFDSRIREVSTPTTLSYGLLKGENDIYADQICAQFHIESHKAEFKSLILYFWLPYPKGTLYSRRKLSLADKAILKVGLKHYYKPKATITNLSSDIIEQNTKSNNCIHDLTIYRDKKARYHQHSDSCEIDTYWFYYKLITDKSARDSTLETFTDIALEEWLEKVRQTKIFVISKYYDTPNQYLVEDGIYSTNLEEAMKFRSAKKCRDFISSLENKQYKPYCVSIMWIGDNAGLSQ